ncbi:uncharacterized protein LOC102808889 [Saccoglossus kowalevskii]|uniref:Uncharacterized protein LOC102808889 n=1 Tax=Saccoglossus kowalevskii TaxID=10224 RepID=A0ABM0MSV1_SACKO|nr:PREDICTED: uncharacterized protein LOC102808889 [Saccoglossus kowalevskii]
MEIKKTFTLVMCMASLVHVCYSGLCELAEDTVATQSSTLEDASAERAIDGNDVNIYNMGSCTQTSAEHQPWWMVDLGRSQIVHHVVVTNRGDCCEKRLDGAVVTVGDTADHLANPQCGNQVDFEKQSYDSKIKFLCDENQVGRYVGVYLKDRHGPLTLCEVEVYGGKKVGGCLLWTNWMNNNDKSGNVDNETISASLATYPDTMCENPTGIEARTVGSRIPAESSNQVFAEYNLEEGFLCRSADQAQGQNCFDYEVRYCCAGGGNNAVVIAEKVSHSEAVGKCESKGMSMYKVHDKTSLAHALSTINQSGIAANNFWIDGTFGKNRRINFNEGTHASLEDMKPLFHRGEPNGSGDCLHFWYRSGSGLSLDDGDCDVNQYYLCMH